jgi:hypothetical protein
VRVNDNKTPAYHVNPAVAVNNRGVVAIAWYDRRNDPKGNCHQLFVSASVDGGETFLPNVQASQPLTCPNSPGNWKIYGNTTLSKWYDFDSPDGNNVWVVDLTTPAVTFTNGGDTSGLAAGPDGVFHSAWINGPNGIMQLYSTAFSVQGKAEYEDVTERVKIELAERQFNMDDHTLSVAMRLVNTGASPLKGPLKVVWKSMRTNLDMRAANADDQQSGLGAAWMFKIGSQELQRGEKSELRDLRFVFDGKLVESAKSAERMSFRVFAPVAK